MDPAGAIFYTDHFEIYGVGFHQPGADHADSGLEIPGFILMVKPVII